MSRSTLTIEDNIKGPEPAVPFSERRDSSELYRQPHLHGGSRDCAGRRD